jgi:hypothetical protein
VASIAVVLMPRDRCWCCALLVGQMRSRLRVCGRDYARSPPRRCRSEDLWGTKRGGPMIETSYHLQEMKMCWRYASLVVSCGIALLIPDYS